MSSAAAAPLPTVNTPLLRPAIQVHSQSQTRLSHRARRRDHRRSKRTFLANILPASIALILLLAFAFIAYDVSSLGDCVTPLCRALGGDKGLEDIWWRNQGPYAPFRSLGKFGAQKGLPRGCEVDQVTVLHRHTARYPTSSAGQCILRSLSKLKHREVRLPRGPHELAFLAKTDLDLRDWEFDGLMDQGRKQAWVSGRKIREIYAKFLRSAKVFTRSSGGGRVVETSGYWLEGFNGQRFKLKDKKRLPLVDVVIPEGETANNTLSVHTCPAFNALDPTPGNVHRATLSQQLQPTITRLNEALRPQPPLEVDDLLCLADMCGYDSQASGQDWNGWSKWCGVFTPQEWEILGYGKDLSRWYDVGQGGRYGPTMGAGYVNELIARLTDSEVVDTTITNRTINADENLFPRGGKRLFVDFGHDNEMLEVLAAMGVKHQRRDLPSDHVPTKRTFIVSEIVPFGGKITFERVACDTGNWEPDPEVPEGDHDNHDQPYEDRDHRNRGRYATLVGVSDGGRGRDGKKDYVRILVNDKVELVDHEACRYSGLIEHGLCEMEAFVDSQRFATTDVDWNICYEHEKEGREGSD
ncbi:hypothetical protein I316_01984 [Kwoniella heveanensis BCC8398]|uniref:Phytase n=1 Tax=Kwoniella heveanensis BCC8398 TaxID=1296120 RepID=A0A1B9GYN4_9TREE|nr:hypothetical protein I316_01984 [Kwoniella heveanensis BCC8398]